VTATHFFAPIASRLQDRTGVETCEVSPTSHAAVRSWAVGMPCCP